MNLIKEAAKLIGWLAGALAGIMAILYACGYLVVQTQLHLLGIDALLPSGREYYLQEGANFFIATGQKLAILVLGLVALILLVCIPLSILAKNEKGLAWLTLMKERFLGIYKKHQWVWQAAAIILMFILLAFPLVDKLDLFRAPLELSGLLQGDRILGGVSEEAAKIWTLLTAGNVARLSFLYGLLLTLTLFAGFLVVVMRRITSAWPLKSLLLFPFLLVFAMYLFLLPLNYGVLEKRIAFPCVTFISTVEKVSGTSCHLLLLNKTEQEFIIWDQAEKRALWLPRDKMAKVEIGQVRPVFTKDPGKGKGVP